MKTELLICHYKATINYLQLHNSTSAASDTSLLHSFLFLQLTDTVMTEWLQKHSAELGKKFCLTLNEKVTQW